MRPCSLEVRAHPTPERRRRIHPPARRIGEAEAVRQRGVVGPRSVQGAIEAAAQAMSRRGERFEPGPMALTYERLYESKYRRLYPALRDVLLAK